MVEEKGLPGHVADRIGEFVVLRGKPQELLAKLSEASEFFYAFPALNPPRSAAAAAAAAAADCCC